MEKKLFDIGMYDVGSDISDLLIENDPSDLLIKNIRQRCYPNTIPKTSNFKGERMERYYLALRYEIGVVQGIIKENPNLKKLPEFLMAPDGNVYRLLTSDALDELRITLASYQNSGGELSGCPVILKVEEYRDEDRSVRARNLLGFA